MATNLGQLADDCYAKKAELAAAQAKANEIDQDLRSMEERLMNLMEEAGTEAVRGTSVGVTINETDVHQIQDPLEFDRFLLRRKAPFLLQRRIAPNAYREMQQKLGSDKPLPGTIVFTKKRLNFTKRK